ncbi:ribosome silencing factor [Terriglobus sp. RCC_193]|uniref:ribosome silencing factor n=1 Tax=Terriglobus sp. RCC_193 TaxID=3239218 RepID=UPI003525EF08
MPTLEANRLLAAAVDAADSKKAEDIRILALDPSESSLTDYFLICSGTNERQNVAISDEIEYRLKKDFGVLPNSVEGRRQGEWVLMDYVDFVVHVFMPEKREYYGLERLRKTAKSISADELNSEIKAAVTRTREKTGVPAAKAPTAKKSTQKAAVKTPTTKAAPKKATAKKTATVAKKTVAKKAVTKKTAVKKATKPAVKSPVAKKVAPKKVAKRTGK